MKQNLVLFLFTLFCMLGCSSRAPIAPGTIPDRPPPSPEEENYGHEVLNQLVEKYPLDRDDGRINRVRAIVTKLTDNSSITRNVWHVHVLVGDDLKNAAATRGNHIFIWTGMVNGVTSDDELATILAHEIGHVLAGHTEPTATEEVGRIISGVAGQAAKQVIYQQGGYYGALAGLGELVVREVLNAMIINPGRREDEFEADHIGLFLMAEAGYDPERAVEFWKRVKNDPDFRGLEVSFFSTHPSSKERLEALEKYLPQAIARYRGEPAPKNLGQNESRKAEADEQPVVSDDTFVLENEEPETETKDFELNGSLAQDNGNVWVVQESQVTVYERPARNSKTISQLQKLDKVRVDHIEGRWLEISEPVKGFVQSFLLAPAKTEK